MNSLLFITHAILLHATALTDKITLRAETKEDGAKTDKFREVSNKLS